MAKRVKKYKVWTVAFHKKGDVTDTGIENFRAESRAGLEKQAKKHGIVIDIAKLKRR